MKQAKHTPTPWIVREHPADLNDFFIQGPRLKPEHPYDVEIMADDHGNELYPTEVKRADAEFIVKACNSYDALVKSLRIATDQAEESGREFGPGRSALKLAGES